MNVWPLSASKLYCSQLFDSQCQETYYLTFAMLWHSFTMFQYDIKKIQQPVVEDCQLNFALELFDWAIVLPFFAYMI